VNHPKIAVVDDKDRVVGAAPIEEAARQGLIHRIVRIILRNPTGDILTVRRSKTEQVWPGRWGESASGHVDEGEDYGPAALREVEEEIGLSGVLLNPVDTYYYESVNMQGVTLKRFNALFTGTTDQQPNWDSDEVEEGRWIAPRELFEWVEREPDSFVPGALRSFEVFRRHLGV
jgi:16S rRNA (adenine1518-N6/adenine1519-N6)-dimethyltransferase